MSDLFDDVDEEGEEEEPVEVEGEVVDSESVDGGDASVPSAPDADNSLLQPVADAEEVVAVYDKFEEIKSELLDHGTDTTEIGDSIHVNKSGWRKMATAFNVSTSEVDKEKEVDGRITRYRVKARATAPNGKTADGVAMCSSNESNFTNKIADDNTPLEEAERLADRPDRLVKVDGAWRELPMEEEVDYHNLYAIAYTRAVNRAISDLVGGGEVSAEELEKEDFFD